MRSSSKKIVTRELLVEEPSFCDSMWACVLNDYVEEDITSVQTDPSDKEDHRVRRRQERKDRRERRRSSSRSSRRRSRSKSRNVGGGSRHRRRGSSSHSRVSSSHSKSHRESSHHPRRDSRDSRIEEDHRRESRMDDYSSRRERHMDDYSRSSSRRESRMEDEVAGSERRERASVGRERTSTPFKDDHPVVKTEEEDLEIPSAPSVEMRKTVDPDASERQVDDEPAVVEGRTAAAAAAIENKMMERKRPSKLTIASFGDDSPRETAPTKRDEPPPVLFRPIKSRYNPKSPTSGSSPRVMSPVTSPRSPSHMKVDSAEFSTMEDYQKKVLESRTKRSGRRFERIQAVRASKQFNKVDP